MRIDERAKAYSVGTSLEHVSESFVEPGAVGMATVDCLDGGPRRRRALSRQVRFRQTGI
jgi:hypothetical protein